nr:MAG: thymidylate synthase [Vulcanisaeta sp. AZ3]
MPFNYEIINEESNIAIATLWTNTKQIKTTLGNTINKVGIIGNIYTPIGINHMLTTLAKHNNINTLILYGTDINGIGDYIIQFFKEGKIPKLLIPKEVAEEIRKTVKVIDLRNEYKTNNNQALLKTIEENYKPGNPTRPSREITIKEEPKNNWETPLMGALIYETNTYRAWIKLIDLILRFGVTKELPNNTYREFLGVNIIIDGTKTTTPMGRPINEKQIKINKEALETITNTLSENPYTTNAIHKNEYLIQGIITGDYYNQTTYIPTLDAFNEWCKTIIEQWALAKAIVEEINKRFNAWYKVGNVGIIIFSARIKEDQVSKAQDFVKRNEAIFREFIEDPRGNFTIEKQNGQVIIEHRYPKTHELIEKLTFNTLNQAYNYLKNRNYFTTYSHALYLGKEITRAFLEEYYTQDKE